ncbi:MAG: metallophosphoesterase, partial [Candidatus Aminicenantes bacterium]|nr:metallophosphoesterase [Candidatus Aminicenantes bacterium]
MLKPVPPQTPARAPLWKRLVLCPVALLVLAALSPAAQIPCEWSGVEKIVAVGDIHGAYESLVEIMRGTELIDDMNRWIGGRAHFVQNGDIMDRGSRAKAIFDLLRELQKEAKAAGGMVHVLIGNHEEMNITGIAFEYEDYITVEQFYDFLPDGFKAAKNKEFLKSIKDEPSLRPQDNALDFLNPLFRQFWKDLLKEKGERGAEARGQYYVFFNEHYGNWLLRQNAVIKINDVVFVHGGLNEEYSTWKLVDINNLIRQELEFFRGGRLRGGVYREVPAFRPRMVYAPDGPLWFRDLARKDESSALPMVIRILDNLKARAMVIAHTFWRGENGSPIVDMRHMSRFRYPDGNGRIYIIDTGISAVYGGVPSALVFIDGRPILWGDPEEEMPPRSSRVLSGKAPEDPEEAEAFLRTAAISKVSRPREEAGRSAPRRVFLDDGKNLVGTIFKYIDRRRPQD